MPSQGLRETRPYNVISLVGEKRYHIRVIWSTAPRTPIYSVTTNVARSVFEHESPDKRILAWSKRAVGVAVGAKTNRTGVEFDPGHPSATTTADYEHGTK